jgi:2-polyprenyl-3-methyl-5-hydroxy-6-metoxy-1,4-benzoquinol methylase
MDHPGLDAVEHGRALAGLGRLNLASGICRQLWKPVAGFARRRDLSHLRVLDIASGGGDVSLGLWQLAQRQGVDLQIVGLDVSPTACQYANHRCEQAGGAIAFRQADVTREALPMGFDVVTSSLFLHHLSFAEAAALLTKMAGAGRLLLMSDLRRCTSGYTLAQIACRTLTRSSVVHFDGPQSVANAFSLREMRQLSRAAGLLDATVRRAWPCRMMLVHERS